MQLKLLFKTFLRKVLVLLIFSSAIFRSVISFETTFMCFIFPLIFLGKTEKVITCFLPFLSFRLAVKSFVFFPLSASLNTFIYFGIFFLLKTPGISQKYFPITSFLSNPENSNPALLISRIFPFKSRNKTKSDTSSKISLASSSASSKSNSSSLPSNSRSSDVSIEG